MTKRVLFVVALSLSSVPLVAHAQPPADAELDEQGPPVDEDQNPYGPPPIPPQVEEAPISGPGGAYCYNGPHPVDRSASAGPDWDNTPGQHSHFYPPVDTRLFSVQNGCYTFVGDPTDFGYNGQVYSYYGAHPLLDSYGGGWCFMIGPHSHAFMPWSSSFVVVGNWYYWQGVYDAYFWNYWPYYSYYYRSYYPRFYAGGRFYRGGSFQRAPSIRSVPNAYASGWRGGAPGYRNDGRTVSRPVGSGWQRTTPSGGQQPPMVQQPRRSAAPVAGWSRPAPGGGQSAGQGAGSTGGWVRPATPTAAPSSGWSRPATPGVVPPRPAAPAHSGWHRR